MNQDSTLSNTRNFSSQSSRKSYHDPFFFPFYAFLLTVFTFVIALAFLGILGYHNNTILRSDLFGQYIGFIQMFLRVLRGEESFWYSFSIYLGSGTALTYAYYTINPFNLLYLIDGISIPAMTAIIVTLKLGLCAATFEIFAQKVLKRRSFDTVLFSMCYALGSYAVTMHYNIMWLDAIYLVPIIVWLIFRLVNTGKYLALTFTFFYLFITNFYMGYMVGIFSFVVFILYLLYRFPLSDRSNIKRCFLIGIKFAYSALLAIGICAFILVPTASFLFANMAEDNASFSELQPSLFDMLNSLFIGEMQTLDTQVPLLYCGIPILLLLPFYFISRKIEKKEKIYVGIAIAFLIICMIYLPLYKFMHAFDYPNMYGFRFAFLLVFLLVALACRIYAFVNEINHRHLFLYAGCLIVFYSVMIQMQASGLIGVLYTNSQNGLLINAFFIILWALLFYCIQTKESRKRICIIASSLLLVIELSVNAYLCIVKEEHPCVSEDRYNQWYQSESDALNQIQASDSSFYRVHVINEESYNAASLWGFNATTTFSSSDNYPLRRALSSLGIATSNRFISEIGYTPITNMLFAAKYSIEVTPYESIAAANTGIVPAVVESNPYSLSLGYMVSPYITSYEPSANPFYNQEYLLSSMCGTAYSFFEPIPLEELFIEKENVDYSYFADYLNFYHLSDYYSSGQISFAAPHQDGKIFYICFPQDNPSSLDTSPRIIAKKYGIDEIALLAYGAIAEGVTTDLYERPSDIVILYFLPEGLRDYSCNNMYTCYYNGTNLEAAYQDLAKGNWNITNYRDDCITGTVAATEERPILFTSIPYDKAWHAYVDGEEVPTYSAVSDAFLSVLLTPGEHTVTLQYVAGGSDIGLMITTFSIALLLISVLLSIWHGKDKKSSQ